jgi:hypothetical protein
MRRLKQAQGEQKKLELRMDWTFFGVDLKLRSCSPAGQDQQVNLDLQPSRIKFLYRKIPYDFINERAIEGAYI